jgi:hypothetical protein
LKKKQEIYAMDKMDKVRLLCLLVSLASILFLMIGLVKPWMMLWWEDVQNRRKVIKIYGLVAIVFYVIYLGLKFIPIA